MRRPEEPVYVSGRDAIELMRCWVKAYKPLPKVKEELDRIVPLANALYRSGDMLYRRRELESTQKLLHEALLSNPNHLKARLLLGQVLLEQGQLNESVKELEEAYRYDEPATRTILKRVLLTSAIEYERFMRFDDALTAYERILEISPRDNEAYGRLAVILIKRGDQALQAGNLDEALDIIKVGDILTGVFLHRVEPCQSLTPYYRMNGACAP